MRRLVFASTLFITATTVGAQVPQPASKNLPVSPPETLRSTSALVLVPTSVRTHGGKPVHTLQQGEFRLLDNGVEQHATLDNAERQPLAIVVVLQTGGSARALLANYAGVGTMVETMAGSSAMRAALVTFDSRPEEEWSFTSSIDALADGFQHPEPGDDGAAILDAVAHAVAMLSSQPPGFRRVLLLISQQQDQSHNAHLEDAVRRLCEQNVTIYTVSFSPQKAWLKDQFTKPRHGQPPYQLSPIGPTVNNTFDIGTPLGVALSALRTNTAAEIAALSGGESFTFASRRELEEQLLSIANDLPNRYALAFQPRPVQPGFHTLEVQLPRYPDLDVNSRASYWAEPR